MRSLAMSGEDIGRLTGISRSRRTISRTAAGPPSRGRVEDGRGSLGPMANAPFPTPARSRRTSFSQLVAGQRCRTPPLPLKVSIVLQDAIVRPLLAL
jgi:hypothetical protein